MSRSTVYCSVCNNKMEPEAGELKVTGDTKLLLYREPNGTTSTCCISCYVQIERAHYRLVKNIRHMAKTNREYLKEQKKNSLTLPTECDRVCA